MPARPSARRPRRVSLPKPRPCSRPYREIMSNLQSRPESHPNRATPPLDERSRHLRRLVVQALEGGGRGHVGSSMSLIEILRVFYDDVLRTRSDAPRWAGRDRLILSKGHGCLALYAV